MSGQDVSLVGLFHKQMQQIACKKPSPALSLPWHPPAPNNVLDTIMAAGAEDWVIAWIDVPSDECEPEPDLADHIW